MNILITGATGSFGNAFVKRLLQDNFSDRIVVYSRDELKPPGQRPDMNFETAHKIVAQDKRDLEQPRVCDSCGRVFDFKADSPMCPHDPIAMGPSAPKP